MFFKQDQVCFLFVIAFLMLLKAKLSFLCLKFVNISDSVFFFYPDIFTLPVEGQTQALLYRHTNFCSRKTLKSITLLVIFSVRKEMQPVPSKSKISSTTDTPQTGPGK